MSTKQDMIPERMVAAHARRGPEAAVARALWPCADDGAADAAAAEPPAMMIAVTAARAVRQARVRAELADTEPLPSQAGAGRGCRGPVTPTVLVPLLRTVVGLATVPPPSLHTVVLRDISLPGQQRSMRHLKCVGMRFSLNQD
jgi:hypothetical protein